MSSLITTTLAYRDEPELKMGGDQPSSFSIGGTNIDFFFPQLIFFFFFFFFKIWGGAMAPAGPPPGPSLTSSNLLSCGHVKKKKKKTLNESKKHNLKNRGKFNMFNFHYLISYPKQ